MLKFLKKARESEIGMKVIERLTPYCLDLEFKKAMVRYRECDNIKKKSQIRKEISAYKKFWRSYPHDYFLLDFFRADNPITQDEIINYIPAFFWYSLFLPHHTSYINSSIIDNKIFTEQVFGNLRIAQPETLGMIINNKFYLSEMRKSTLKGTIEEISRINPTKIFVKPANGGAGIGIFIFQRTPEGQYLTRRNILFNEDFLLTISRSGDYIIQSGITQDQELSKIYPGSVNAMRIFTENKDGVSSVVCAVLRIGRGQAEIDNVSTGGIFTKIDLKSGKTGDYAMTLENEKILEHPDTHFVFRNFKIPQWSKVCNFVTDSADKLPLFAHLGWDIALTANGPIAIEANLNQGHAILQFANGGLREKMGITDPAYYWKNPGKRL
jgi:hypothetical protein